MPPQTKSVRHDLIFPHPQPLSQAWERGAGGGVRAGFNIGSDRKATKRQCEHKCQNR
ncbi:MAG: hypothetical protein KME17_28665 [Cyanosarcina radialis HA8281-LM2]|nr:hypothetical protein [Cyanosarcina radialis HA8281-LM2]